MNKPTLTPADYQRAAVSLCVEVATIQAVTDVESRRRGFLADGRPIILFERHIMYRLLMAEAGLGDAVALAIANPGIINRTPGGYKGGAAEWDRLDAAVKINRHCALQSASWGLFQIMGMHWARLRFQSPQAFVNAMFASESAQLDAFVEFVRTDPPLHQALLTRDWVTFAKRYNGPDYAKNAYDRKLAAAYASYLKEKPNADQ